MLSQTPNASSSYLPTQYRRKLPRASNATADNNATTINTLPLDQKAPSKSNQAPSPTTYRILVATFVLYSVFLGWYASTRPKGKWKSPFSWHPFLMTVGMTGSMGIAAVTKKLGGYTNTKLHGILASLGFFVSLGGVYAIYHNKNLYQRPHFTSVHGKVGIAVVAMMALPMLAGAVFLHPDFGIDKTNKLYRKIHKLASRVLMAVAWGNSLYGLYGMRSEHPMELILYGVPLVVLMPMTLL